MTPGPHTVKQWTPASAGVTALRAVLVFGTPPLAVGSADIRASIVCIDRQAVDSSLRWNDKAALCLLNDSPHFPTRFTGKYDSTPLGMNHQPHPFIPPAMKTQSNPIPSVPNLPSVNKPRSTTASCEINENEQSNPFRLGQTRRLPPTA
jgi:hypothetical protein